MTSPRFFGSLIPSLLATRARSSLSNGTSIAPDLKREWKSSSIICEYRLASAIRSPFGFDKLYAYMLMMTSGTRRAQYHHLFTQLILCCGCQAGAKQFYALDLITQRFGNIRQ